MAADAPWDGVLVFARAVLSPVHPHPFPPHEAWLLFLAAGLILAIALKTAKDVGLTSFETATLLLLAPLVATVEAPLGQPQPHASLAMNLAGFFIPLAVSLKLLAEGRAPLVPTLVALAITSGVAYASSEAVPSEGVLLYYRMPAVAAGVLALVIARGAAHRVGPVAYVAGAGGVIIGADALRVPELLGSAEPHRIIIGGAGVLDGIFLVGLLAVLLGAFGAACAASARAFATSVKGRAPSEVLPTTPPRAAADGVEAESVSPLRRP